MMHIKGEREKEKGPRASDAGPSSVAIAADGARQPTAFIYYSRCKVKPRNLTPKVVTGAALLSGGGTA
jgi:hypothetical protein